MAPGPPSRSTSARCAMSSRARCPTPPTAWGCWRWRRRRGLRARSSSPDDHAVQEMAESTRERAMKLGIDAGDVQTYGAGDSNFAPSIYKGSADALIVFGETRDTADVLRTLKKLAYAPRLFFARSASDPRFIRMVGQDAEFTLATKEYDPKFRDRKS